MGAMPLEEGASGPHHGGPDRSRLAAEHRGPMHMREGSRQSPKATAQRTPASPKPFLPGGCLLSADLAPAQLLAPVLGRERLLLLCLPETQKGQGAPWGTQQAVAGEAGVGGRERT